MPSRESPGSGDLHLLPRSVPSRGAALCALSQPRQLFRSLQQLHPCPPPAPACGRHPSAPRAIPGQGQSVPGMPRAHPAPARGAPNGPTLWAGGGGGPPPPIFMALLSPAGRPPAQLVLRPWRARRCSAPRHGRGGVRGPGRAGAGGPPWWRRRRPPPCRMSPSCSHPIWMTSSLKVGGNPGLHMGQGSPRAGSSHGCFCVPPRKPLQQDRDVAAGVRVSRGGRRGQTWGSLCHDAIPTGISVSPWGR